MFIADLPAIAEWCQGTAISCMQDWRCWLLVMFFRVLLSSVRRTAGVDYLWYLSGYCYHLYTGLQVLTTCDVYHWLTCDYRVQLGYCYHLYTGLQVLTSDAYHWLTCDCRVMPRYCYHLYTGLQVLTTCDVYRWRTCDCRVQSGCCCHLYTGLEMLTTCDLYCWLTCKYRVMLRYCCHLYTGLQVLTTCDLYRQLTCDYRVQPGYCYHLYTGLKWLEMIDYLPPEMLRTRLEELCLQIKVRLEWSAVCHRVQEDFVFLRDQFWYTCRSGSGLSGQQYVKESRRILCLRKFSSNIHAD